MATASVIEGQVRLLIPFSMECSIQINVPCSLRCQGRAVLGNVIIKTTGAAKAAARVLPELAGKVRGIPLRVPMYISQIHIFVALTDHHCTCNVSLVNVTLNI